MSSSKNTEYTADNIGRSEFIQAMRFVAATLVLVTHTTFYYHERIRKDFSLWPSGAIGVEVFFVISGIVMILCARTLPSNSIGARIFFTRRLLRIVPLYWSVLLLKISIALILPSLVHHNHFDFFHAVKSFFFIPTFNAEGDIRPIHGVGWTLQHEMFFYIIFSAAMLFGVHITRWVSAIILGFVAIGYVFSPQSALIKVVTNPINLYFVIGMIIGSNILQNTTRHRISWNLPIGLILIALLKWGFPEQMKILPFAPFVLISGAFMLLFAARRLPNSMRITCALGDSSYALYLFHPLAAPAVLLGVHKIASSFSALTEIFITVVLTIILAHFIHKLFELPLNHLIKQFFNFLSEKFWRY